MWGGDLFFVSSSAPLDDMVRSESPAFTSTPWRDHGSKSRPSRTSRAASPTNLHNGDGQKNLFVDFSESDRKTEPVVNEALDDDFLSDDGVQDLRVLEVPFDDRFLHVAALTNDDGDVQYSAQERVLIQALRFGTAWEELMEMGRGYVESEQFNLTLGKALKNKERKMHKVVELNTIYDEIRTVARNANNLSSAAEHYMFSAIQQDMDEAMALVQAEQNELHSMQRKEATLLASIIAAQAKFVRNERIYQRDLPVSATASTWEQFLKDVCRENISLKVSECLGLVANKDTGDKRTTDEIPQQALRTLHLSHHSATEHDDNRLARGVSLSGISPAKASMLQRRASRAQIAPQPSESVFLDFLIDYLEMTASPLCRQNSDILLSLLPQVMGRTVNAGIPYEITRTLLCHPRKESLTPLRVSDPDASRIKLHIEVDEANQRLVMHARMMNFFRKISLSDLEDCSGVKTFTMCRMTMDLQRLHCVQCDELTAKQALQIRIKNALPVDSVDSEAEEQKMAASKPNVQHRCPYNKYVLLRRVLHSLGDSILARKCVMRVMSMLNPYDFVTLSRTLTLDTFDVEM